MFEINWVCCPFEFPKVSFVFSYYIFDMSSDPRVLCWPYCNVFIWKSVIGGIYNGFCFFFSVLVYVGYLIQFLFSRMQLVKM